MSSDFTPIPGRSYEEELAWAIREFDDVVKVLDRLDTKAERLLRLYSASAGLGAFASLHAYKEYNLEIVLIVPALVLLILAIYFSMRAFRPDERTTPPDTFEALKFATDPDKHALMAESTARASRQNKVIARTKSIRIRNSIRFYSLAAICIVLVPLVKPLIPS